MIDFYESGSGRSLLQDIREGLTPVQLATFVRQVRRLEKHGWALGAQYSKRIKGSPLGLYELRLTLDKVEVRLLYAHEGEQRLRVVHWFKKKVVRLPPRHIETAEQRLLEWRARKS